MILIFNKIDAYTYVKKEQDDLTPITKENYSLEDLKDSWMSKINGNVMFISSHKTCFDKLREELYTRIKEIT